MRTKKVKRVKFLKGEKFMFFLIVFLGLIVMPSAWVYTKALLSESNIELERIKKKINKYSRVDINIKDIEEYESFDDVPILKNKFNIARDDSR